MCRPLAGHHKKRDGIQPVAESHRPGMLVARLDMAFRRLLQLRVGVGMEFDSVIGMCQAYSP